MKNLICILFLVTFSFSKTIYWWADISIDSIIVQNAAIKDAYTDWENNQAKIYFHDSSIRDSRIDPSTGLYSYIFGSSVNNCLYYFPTYNQTIRELVKINGKPKNSYYKWIDLIENPSDYFLTNKNIRNLNFDTTYTFELGQDTISFALTSLNNPVRDTFDVVIAFTKPVIDSIYMLANAQRESTFKFALGPDRSNLAFLVYKCVVLNRETIACLDILRRKKLSEQDLKRIK